jgi:NAD(P)-dependent dehydrogenase (short-subunit alcohol dehydrogenase family)
VRVALVTGAARGIGHDVATRLLDDGWAVVLTDVDESVTAMCTQLAARGAPVRAVVGSVHDEQHMEAAVATAVHDLGGLDLAVANAAVGGPSVDVVDLAGGPFDDVVAVNLRGTYLTVKVAGRVMKEQRRGAIVVMGSMFGQVPVAGDAAYCATKAATTALAQSAALELGPYGVRVNGIAPGYIATDMRWEVVRARAASNGSTFDDEVDSDVRSVPLRRYGTGADVAGAVAFLASDDASYITGHVLDVNGGVQLR